MAQTDGDLADERRLHKTFSKDWSHGEWFRRSDGLMLIIDSVSNSHKNLLRQAERKLPFAEDESVKDHPQFIPLRLLEHLMGRRFPDLMGAR